MKSCFGLSNDYQWDGFVPGALEDQRSEPLVGSENGSSVFSEFPLMLSRVGTSHPLLFSVLKCFLKNVFLRYIGLIFSALNIFKGLCFLLLTWFTMFSYDFIVILHLVLLFKRPITFWEDHMTWWPAWQDTGLSSCLSLGHRWRAILWNQLRPLLQLHPTSAFFTQPFQAFHFCLHLW